LNYIPIFESTKQDVVNRSHHFLKLIAMKKYLLRASGIAAMAVLLSTSVFAQDEKEKNKHKVDDGDVIVITKKGGKDSRTVIEVRDGEVTVNGRPLEEYKDGDVIIRRSPRTGERVAQSRVYSPFRSERSEGQGGSWNEAPGAGGWNSNGTMFDSKGGTAYLGVVTESTSEGARITSVSNNTAAERAGLKEGDVITHIDEDRIDDHDALTKAIRKHKPEEKINVTILRDGRERQMVATLGRMGGNTVYSAPAKPKEPLRALEPMKVEGFKNNGTYEFKSDGTYEHRLFSTAGRTRLGIRAQDTEDGRGAKVLNVDDESPADKAGIRQDDVIVEFEGKDIRNADDLVEASRRVKDQSSINIRVQRDGRSQNLEIRIPKKLKTTNL
jgi:serine protease Do